MTGRIGKQEFALRRRHLRDAVARGDLAPVVIGPSADLQYLIGDRFRANDRPVLLILSGSAATLVVPELEAMELEPQPADVRVATWRDGDDLAAAVLGALGRVARIAVADDVPFWLVDRLRAEIPHIDAAGPLLRSARARKSAAELRLMRSASRAADLAYAALQDHVLEGMTELEVSRLIAYLLVEHGCDPGTGGALVASGPNAAAPHHAAGPRVLCAGDPVIIDFGGIVGGYCSDTSRTFVIGSASGEMKHIHRTVLEANRAAIARVAPGVPIEEVDVAAREVIAAHGYADRFLHRTGHGIGLEVHEHPYVVAGDSTVLEAGMTFTIEPGVYIPDVGGARVEDVVLVTSDGAVSLNDSPRGLLSLQ